LSGDVVMILFAPEVYKQIDKDALVIDYTKDYSYFKALIQLDSMVVLVEVGYSKFQGVTLKFLNVWKNKTVQEVLDEYF